MDSRPLISIIVPVFNTEQYLSTCLESIIAQSYKNWECLLVDDGSSDRSGSICDEYARKDSRFIVIHKENGGVSSARNLGIQGAVGDWITFADSDDFIGVGYLEGLCSPILSDGSIDFVQGGCSNYIETEEVSINQLYSEYIGRDRIKVFNEVRGLIVSKLFKRKIVLDSGLKFDQQMAIAEDMAFTMDYIQHIDKYAFVSEVGYYYRRDNLSSATHKARSSVFQETKYSFLHLYASAFSYISKNGISEADAPVRYQQQALSYYSMICSIYSDWTLARNGRKRLLILKEESSSEYFYLLRFIPNTFKHFPLVKILQKRFFLLFDFLQIVRRNVKRIVEK